MRTTLRLDDDILIAVKERARRENRTAGEVLSELARRGLNRSEPTQSGQENSGFYGFEPLPPRGASVSNALLDHLREDDLSE